MTDKTKIFISYKTGVENGLTTRAKTLRKILDPQFDTWMDTTKLIPGIDWDKQIYDAIPDREILVLLLAEETMNSDWVRREVYLAKGALVSILPVKINANFELQKALDFFGIQQTQTLTLSNYTPEEKQALVNGINQLKTEARKNQEEWLRQRLNRAEDKPKVFISHNADEDTDFWFEVNLLKESLEEKSCEVMGTKPNKIPGFDSHLETINQSDVVLALITPKSVDSLVVKRQVDVAKGAGIKVIPIVCRTDFQADQLMNGITRKLGLESNPLIDSLPTDDADLKTLHNIILSAKEETRKNHIDRFQNLFPNKEYSNKTEIGSTYTPANKQLYAYELPGNSSRIYLAAGDMFTMKDIDVIVNSENNYMQMARFFEVKTVSHKLRKLGAHFDEFGFLLEDTVQNELSTSAFAEFGRLPVPDGSVIVTSAGHADARLRKENHTRYIFHAATIIVTDTGIEPVHVSATKKSVKTALELFWSINEQKGLLVSQQQVNPDYHPINSIIFPLFGTGHGQRSVSEAIIPMAEAFFEFLKTTSDNQAPGPNEIYLSVYSKKDIELADEVLCRFFQKIT